MVKTHEVRIYARLTKNAVTDPTNTTTVNIDYFVVDGRDEREVLLTGATLTDLQDAILAAAQAVYTGNVSPF